MHYLPKLRLASPTSFSVIYVVRFYALKSPQCGNNENCGYKSALEIGMVVSELGELVRVKFSRQVAPHLFQVR
jgi:hypothetical protein